MRNEITSNLETPLSATVTLRNEDGSGGPRELGTAPVRQFFTPGSAPTAETRESILRSLYTERSDLLRRKRLGGFSNADEESLMELNQYIDDWEAFDQKPRESSEVWSKLEMIAGSLVALQASIERAKE